MKWLYDLFSESGDVSSLRVMSMICVLGACAIAIIGLNKPVVDYSGLSLLCSSFLGAGLGSKVLQKKTEVDGSRAEMEINASSAQQHDLSNHKE
jgi:hypothetical protein